VFVLLALWVSWSTRAARPSGTTHATVTLAPGAIRPSGLTVTDLHDVAELQARFNADKGRPRLVLALAPT
jgi:hypothetical protein